MTEENSIPNKEVELEKLFKAYVDNFEFDFKFIDPKKIIVAQWVRMKCTFGCIEYGKNAFCPPNVPSVSECELFFHEYHKAAIFHFAKQVEKPEDRHAWTRKINVKLLDLEREVFLAGYERAFLLFMDSCSLCIDCAGSRDKCQKPQMARPGPEAMAVDVYSTVRQYGFPIEVRTNYAQEMNRYAFLMIE